MGVEFMLSGRSSPSESTTVAPTSGKVTKPLRRVVALRARPGSTPRPARANVVSRPSSPGRRADDEHRSRLRSTRSRSSPRSSSASASGAPTRPHARAGRRAGGCDRRAQVRHLDEDRAGTAVPRLVERGEHGLRIHPPAARRSEVDRAELRSDGAPQLPGPPRPSWPAASRWRSSAAERRAAVGVGDDRGRQSGVADGLPHGPRCRAVQGGGQRRPLPHRRPGTAPRHHPGPRRSRRGTGRPRCSDRSPRRHRRRRLLGRATRARLPAPRVRYPSPRSVRGPMARTDSEATAERSSSETRLGWGQVGHVLPHETWHRHDEDPSGRFGVAVITGLSGRGRAAHDERDERGDRGQGCAGDDHAGQGAGPERPLHRRAKRSR